MRPSFAMAWPFFGREMLDTLMKGAGFCDGRPEICYLPWRDFEVNDAKFRILKFI